MKKQLRHSMKTAFSLMEMMVVLLIVAIIAAATAPMVSKKMARSAASGDSPWVFTNSRGDVAFNLSGRDQSVIIGVNKYNADGGPTNPRLVLAAGDATQPALVFAKPNGDYFSEIDINSNAQRVTMSAGSGNVGNKSVAIGTSQTHAEKEGTTAIGQGTTTNAQYATAVGQNAKIEKLSNDEAISATAIGASSTAVGPYATVLGAGARAHGKYATAVGQSATTAPDTGNTTKESLAVGAGARAKGNQSTAIGTYAAVFSEKGIAIGHNVWQPAGIKPYRKGYINIGDKFIYSGSSDESGDAPNNLITLGDSNDTVSVPGTFSLDGNLHIPGNVIIDGDLLVRKNVALCVANKDHPNAEYYTAILTEAVGSSRYAGLYYAYRDGQNIPGWANRPAAFTVAGETIEKNYNCDKRLKNIGKKYTAGLAELKKLDFYHFTFKADNDKTPQVGVIAQDLQKVFPTAVVEGPDKYLRIRWDEMFYAVINAVKELDTRITELAEQVKANFDKVTKLEATVEAQQKTIDELKAQNVEFEKRLAKLEKAEKKSKK